MTDDLEARITQTLTETAESEPYRELLPAVADRGRRQRTRWRLAVGAATGAVAVAAAVVVAATVPALRSADRQPTVHAAQGGTPSASASPNSSPTTAVRVPTPPTASGAPSAESDPSVVGSDPTLIHLGLSWAPGKKVQTVTWSSRAGSESVRVEDFDAGAMLERSRAAVMRIFDPSTPAGTTKIGGVRAEVYRAGGRYHVVWQPHAGLWAGTYGGSRSRAIEVARATRFDTVYQCPSPARLGHLPSGFALRGCELELEDWGNAGYQYGSTLYLQNADQSRTVTVGFSDIRSEMPADEADGTMTIRGHQAIVMNKNGTTTVRVTEFGGFHSIDVTGDGVPTDELAATIDGLHVTGKPDRPETWTTHPVH